MPDEQRAYKVTGYETAKVPKPSQRLYEAMALKGWIDYKERMELHVGHEMPDWDELPAELKDVWKAVAHGQHAIILLHAGCRLRQIPNA